jgi:hypothetical protein
MLTLPSCSQLLDIIRGELPQVADLDEAGRGELLGLLDGLLAVIEQRCEHEAAWMLEESLQIDELAGYLVDRGHDRDGTIGRAGAEFQLLADTRPDELRDRYHARSQLLSNCIPAALAAGGDARARLEGVIDTRLEHEAQIRGRLSLVARG